MNAHLRGIRRRLFDHLQQNNKDPRDITMQLDEITKALKSIENQLSHSNQRDDVDNE